MLLSTMVTNYNHNVLPRPNGFVILKHLGLIRQGIDGNFKMFNHLVVDVDLHHGDHGEAGEKGRRSAGGLQLRPAQVQDLPVVDVFVDALKL